MALSARCNTSRPRPRQGGHRGWPCACRLRPTQGHRSQHSTIPLQRRPGHLQRGTSPDHLPSSPDLDAYAMLSNLSRMSIRTLVTPMAPRLLNARSGHPTASAVPAYRNYSKSTRGTTEGPLLFSANTYGSPGPWISTISPMSDSYPVLASIALHLCSLLSAPSFRWYCPKLSSTHMRMLDARIIASVPNRLTTLHMKA